MKLTKIYSILTAALLIFCCSSCYDLDRAPDNQLSSSTFFRNETHAKEAMMAVYAYMQRDLVYGLAFANDGLGGICAGYDNPSMQTFQRSTINSGNSYVSSKWSNCYEGIARANNVLQHIDECDMDDALKTQYKAEARFMRAIYYGVLTDFFGGVPLYDETTQVSTEAYTMLKPRSTLEQCRQFIEDDYAFAAQYLPDAWDQANNGRATSVAANALRGRNYLYWKKYDKSAEMLKKVIDSGKSRLNDSYADLFKPEGDSSPEIIFAVQNLGGTGNPYGMPLCFYLGSRSSFGSCWNNVSASISFVNSYEYTDGRPFDWDEAFDGKSELQVYGTVVNGGSATKIDEESPYKEQILEMYENRDPRMMASIILPLTYYKGWMNNKETNSYHIVAKNAKGAAVTIANNNTVFLAVNGGNCAYPWRKFVPEGDMNGAITNRSYTPINWPIIRYADVLLMYAECLNELGQPMQACDYINQVRARKSVSMPGLNSGPAWLAATTHDQVAERIRHERAVELACEGLSYNDMRRWGLLETLDGRKERKMTTSRTGSWYTRKVTERDYLWPIPSGEIDKNELLEQNPGW